MKMLLALLLLAGGLILSGYSIQLTGDQTLPAAAGGALCGASLLAAAAWGKDQR